jgi:3-oxoacyl-[acyl-carrier-protein] synthase II
LINEEFYHQINLIKLKVNKSNQEARARIGVIWGAGIGGLETFQNEVLGFASD